MLYKDSALYGHTSDDVLAALLQKGRHMVVAMPRGCKHPIRAHEFQDVMTDAQLQSHLQSCSESFQRRHLHTILGMHLNQEEKVEEAQITVPIKKKQKKQKNPNNKRSRNLGGGGSSTLKIIV